MLENEDKKFAMESGLDNLSPREIIAKCGDILDHPIARAIIEWAKTGSEADRHITKTLGWDNSVGIMARNAIYLRDKHPGAWDAFFETSCDEDERFINFAWNPWNPIADTEVQSIRVMGGMHFDPPLPLLLRELKSTIGDLTTSYSDYFLGNCLRFDHFSDLLYNHELSSNYLIGYRGGVWSLDPDKPIDSRFRVKSATCLHSPNGSPPEFWKVVDLWQIKPGAINHIRAGVRTDTGLHFKDREGFIVYERYVKPHLQARGTEWSSNEALLRVHYDIVRTSTKTPGFGVRLSNELGKRPCITSEPPGKDCPGIVNIEHATGMIELSSMIPRFLAQSSHCLDIHKILGHTILGEPEKITDLGELLLTD